MFRLGSTVKKTVLLSWMEGEEVKYKSLRRGRLNNNLWYVCTNNWKRNKWDWWGDLLRKVPLPVGGAKKRNIILLTIWCILRWYIVTFDKTKQLWAYPMSKTNLHHFLFMSVTLTFWVLRPFWALKSDLASVIALQLQHFVCQTFWYIKIRNPSTNKKVIPQNVKWYRFPKGLLC